MVISAFCELPAGGALQRPNDADLWGQRLRARQGDGDGWDGSEISVKFTVNFIHFPRAVCLWRSRGNPDVHNCQEGFDYYLSATSWHWKWDTSRFRHLCVPKLKEHCLLLKILLTKGSVHGFFHCSRILQQADWSIIFASSSQKSTWGPVQCWGFCQVLSVYGASLQVIAVDRW